jgi:teichuronic acid biosynthesis glycosyltransferase TuaC|tara:strand:- start:1650 stop:2651 length:1002 start_codon:yes stop_codon:yes gene_type:complete
MSLKNSIDLKVLTITSEWPTPEHPYSGKFVQLQVQLLREHGVEVEVYPFRGKKNPFRYFSFIKEIRQIARQKNFDLVHCQFGQSGLLGLTTGLPMVVTYRGTDLNGYVDEEGRESIKSKALTAISRFVAKRADQVITVSHRLATKLPKNVNYKVNPSSLNLDLFKPISKQEARKKLRLDENAKIIFFPADPKKKVKRYPLAKEAFDLFSNAYENTQLLYAGNIDFQTMPYHYNAADVIVFTSSSEGSPNAIKETMACNRPIVTVDVGDVKERLEFADGCYIVEDDAKQIAELLIKVIEEKKEIKTRELVSNLSGDNLTKELIDIYKEVVDKSE